MASTDSSFHTVNTRCAFFGWLIGRVCLQRSRHEGCRAGSYPRSACHRRMRQWIALGQIARNRARQPSCLALLRPQAPWRRVVYRWRNGYHAACIDRRPGPQCRSSGAWLRHLARASRAIPLCSVTAEPRQAGHLRTTSMALRCPSAPLFESSASDGTAAMPSHQEKSSGTLCCAASASCLRKSTANSLCQRGRTSPWLGRQQICASVPPSSPHMAEWRRLPQWQNGSSSKPALVQISGATSPKWHMVEELRAGNVEAPIDLA